MSYSSNVFSLLIFLPILLAIMRVDSSIYYAEKLDCSSENQVTSTLECMWRATDTVSTLGFVDIISKSLDGMILGAIATIIGVLTIDLLMSIIIEVFVNVNSYLQARRQ